MTEYTVKETPEDEREDFDNWQVLEDGVPDESFETEAEAILRAAQLIRAATVADLRERITLAIDNYEDSDEEKDIELLTQVASMLE